MTEKIKKIDSWKGILNLYQVNDWYFAGHVTPEAFDDLKNNNITTIVNMRNVGEADFTAEEEFCKKNNIEYHNLPIVVGGQFDPSAILKTAEVIEGKKNVLIHCASGNRIAGWYLIYQVENLNKTLDQAVDISCKCGLTNPGLIQLANFYLEENKAK